MEPLVADLTQALIRFGPAVLAAMAFLETAFLTGFFVPAGVALLVASFLAAEGVLSLPVVVVAAVAGALAGDSVGFFFGRWLRAGGRIESRGWLGRVVARIDPGRLSVLRRRPAYSVSVARVIAFVRTLMPISAGRSDLTYLRFLVYDVIGIVLWATSYVAVGYLAGESWALVSRWVGGFWAALFGILVLGGVVGSHRARRTSRTASRREDAMTTIGLTGNVASGKSAVAAVWAEQGLPVLHADQLARAAVEPGTSGLAAVIEEFGDGVLAADGTLDRGALRKLVFGNDVARSTLEGILHPIIARLRYEWMTEQRAAGAQMVAYEIPLLFETAQEDTFDVIVLVDAPVEIRVQRLQDHRGLTEVEARNMVGAQMPAEEKRTGSDIVIENVGTLEGLKRRAAEVLAALHAQNRVAAGVES